MLNITFLPLFADFPVIIPCENYGVDQLEGQIAFQGSNEDPAGARVAALDRAGKFHYFVLDREGGIESYTYLSTPDRNILTDQRYATLYDYGDRVRFQTLNMIGAGGGTVWYKPLNFEIRGDGGVDTLSQSPPRRPYSMGLLCGGSDNDSISRFYSFTEREENGIQPFSVSYDMAGGWDGDTLYYDYGPESAGMVLMDIDQGARVLKGGQSPDLLMLSYYIPQTILSDYSIELLEIDSAQNTIRRKAFKAIDLGFEQGDKFVAKKALPHGDGYLVAGYRHNSSNIKLGLYVVQLSSDWEFLRSYAYPPEYMFRDLEIHFDSYVLVGETDNGNMNSIFIGRGDIGLLGTGVQLPDVILDYGEGRHYIRDLYIAGNQAITGRVGTQSEGDWLYMTGSIDDNFFFDRMPAKWTDVREDSERQNIHLTWERIKLLADEGWEIRIYDIKGKSYEISTEISQHTNLPSGAYLAIAINGSQKASGMLYKHAE